MKYVIYESGNKVYAEPEFETMVFDIKCFANPDAAKRNIIEFITIALQQGYEVRVRSEDVNFIVIEYNWDNRRESIDLGNDRLMWVSSEEEEYLNDLRYERAAQNARGDRDDDD